VRNYLFIAVLTAGAFFLIATLIATLVSAGQRSVSATCVITCTVTDIVEWSDTSFPAINLGKLTSQNKQVSDSSRLRLYTNADVTFTADNSDAAQLSKDALHTLVTEYKLEYDGSGGQETGGSTVAWTDYDSFLSKGSQVRHVYGDGAVEVILSVRASRETIRTEDCGQYKAVQTLTVVWNDRG